MPVVKATPEQMAFQAAANGADHLITKAMHLYEEEVGHDDALFSAMMGGAMMALVRAYAARGRARGEPMTEMMIIRALTPLLHRSAATFVDEVLDTRN